MNYKTVITQVWITVVDKLFPRCELVRCPVSGGTGRDRGRPRDV